MAANDVINDPTQADNSHWTLIKILRRLGNVLTAAEQPVSIGDVTLTASDIEIGAVEIKNASDDTRAVLKTSDGLAGDVGLLVRNIPSATPTPVTGTLVVTGALTDAELRASPVAISTTQLPAALVGGKLDVNIGSASGSLAVNDGGGSITVDGVFFQATQPVSIAATVAVSGPLTDAQLRASDVNVNVTNAGFIVAVSNFPASQTVNDGGGSLTVDGVFFQATQPVSIAATVAVSGPLTDTELRASPVPVSVASLPLPSGAATESTLSAINGKLPATLGQKTMANSFAVVISSDQSAIAVSGPITDTQLRATPVPVSGTFFQATQPVSIAGTVAISAVSLPLPTGAAQEHTTAASPSSVRLSDGAAFYDATKTGQLPAALVGGRLDVNIGASSATVPVSGTFFQATQPVSSTQLPAALGQTTMANSLAVVLASDQTPLPVSVTSDAIVDGALFINGTTKVMPGGFVLNETTLETALTEGDAGAARIDTKRAQVSVIEDAYFRGRRVQVTALGEQKVSAVSLETLLDALLQEQREIRRVLCEGLFVNYESVTD